MNNDFQAAQKNGDIAKKFAITSIIVGVILIIIIIVIRVVVMTIFD